MQEARRLERASGGDMDLGGNQIWSIGGGKGGVGKTFVAANLAVVLAQKGNEVVMVDADLGGANLHTCLGIAHPERTLSDFLGRRFATLEEVLLPTSVPRLRLISGASDILAAANPRFAQKQKVFRHLRRIRADYVLVDLGAGTSYNVLDFFNIAHRKFLVVTAEPTSIQNGYGFVKSALCRHLTRRFNTNVIVADLLGGGSAFGGPNPPETIKQMTDFLLRESPEVGARFRDEVNAYRCGLVINMASPPRAQKVFSVMRSVSKGFLNLELEFAGTIARDDHVAKSVDRMVPLLVPYPESEAARGLRQIMNRVDHSVQVGPRRASGKSS